MASVGQLRERLRKPLQLELRSGCRDQAVVGGIEKLVASVGKPFADVGELIAGYSQLGPDERRERIDRALRLLASEPSGSTRSQRTGGSAPKVPTADHAPRLAGRGVRAPGEGDVAAGAADPIDPRGLDQEIAAGVVDLGAQAARKLQPVGIVSLRDLLHYFPRRYEDRTALPNFGALVDATQATVGGTVVGRKSLRSRRGMAILRVILDDGRGGRVTAILFNQPWLEKQLFPGIRLIVTGKVKRRGRSAEIAVQHLEVDEDAESLSAGRIVPIYSSVQGLSQAYLRRAVHRLLAALPTLPDHLPRSLLERFELVPLDRALRHIHFPPSEPALQEATKRLKFDEFLLLELRVLLNRDADVAGKRIRVGEEILGEFSAGLPFALTAAQRRAVDEIAADMASGRQMARMLQGDVGSGKTAVAAAAVFLAARSGYQAALMAPTEILARQHYLNLRELLYPLGLRCELVTGGGGAAERRRARARIGGGEVDLSVGTHALIQEGVAFARLGLAVIDEEHRFGVEQRRGLLAGSPHVLVMSATPIPRSLALTYYGDLELSVIDELPPGRTPVTTKLIDARRRAEVYRAARAEIAAGRQVFLVTPLIEESEALDGVVSTTRMFEDLRELLPPMCRVAMLHGRMTGSEKDEVMERFRRHEHDLLVSTTVVEVGVDVPNASLMIIENAERFGLSQLHQLRGRVGRGRHASTCILVAGERSRKTQKRLEVIERNRDGFVIAEKDLALRGPGELRGTRQSGLPDLVLGDLAHDGDIIERTRELAKRMLEADPRLDAPWAARLKEELQRRSRKVALRQVI